MRFILGSLVAVLALGVGCRAHVENLSPEKTPRQFRPLVAYQLIVGVTGADGRPSREEEAGCDRLTRHVET